jgi:hypothetical protein
MDRLEKQRKLRKLQIAVGAAGLAGLGLFSGLAAANTHAGGSRSSTPDQQVTSLENAQGGSFFSAGGSGFAPPSASSGQPQTSSGGS